MSLSLSFEIIEKAKLIKIKAYSSRMTKKFHVLIEQDEDGGYVGKVPELRGCLSQGDTLDELMKNIKEAIELCLEVESEEKKPALKEYTKFVGVQELEV